MGAQFYAVRRGPRPHPRQELVVLGAVRLALEHQDLAFLERRLGHAMAGLDDGRVARQHERAVGVDAVSGGAVPVVRVDRDAQRAQNSRLAEGIKAWCAPLIARGELLPMTPTLFFSQIIGPAQIFCRAWLSGRDPADPRQQVDILIACAIRALVAPEAAQSTGAMS